MRALSLAVASALLFVPFTALADPVETGTFEGNSSHECTRTSEQRTTETGFEFDDHETCETEDRADGRYVDVNEQRVLTIQQTRSFASEDTRHRTETDEGPWTNSTSDHRHASRSREAIEIRALGGGADIVTADCADDHHETTSARHWSVGFQEDSEHARDFDETEDCAAGVETEQATLLASLPCEGADREHVDQEGSTGHHRVWRNETHDDACSARARGEVAGSAFDEAQEFSRCRETFTLDQINGDQSYDRVTTCDQGVIVSTPEGEIFVGVRSVVTDHHAHPDENGSSTRTWVVLRAGDAEESVEVPALL